MVLIPAGEFMMGSPDLDADAPADEKPKHRVRITRPFYLGKYPVTQEQWQAVMGNSPSHFKGPKNPVETVSWNDCQAFLDKLHASRPGRRQIPVAHRAQWEYACRAGSTAKYFFGDKESDLGDYAWYRRTRRPRASGRREEAERLGALRHARERMGVVRGTGMVTVLRGVPDGRSPGARQGSIRVIRGGSWDAPRNAAGPPPRLLRSRT